MMVVIFKRVTDKDMSSSPPLSLSHSLSLHLYIHALALHKVGEARIVNTLPKRTAMLLAHYVASKCTDA